jgi:hypothetical protein
MDHSILLITIMTCGNSFNNTNRPIQALGLWHMAFNMVFTLLLNNYNIYGPFNFTQHDYDMWQLD